MTRESLVELLIWVVLVGWLSAVAATAAVLAWSYWREGR